MSDDPWDKEGFPFGKDFAHRYDWMEEPDWWSRGPWKETPWVDFLNERWKEAHRRPPTATEKRLKSLINRLSRAFAQQQTDLAIQVLTEER